MKNHLNTLNRKTFSTIKKIGVEADARKVRAYIVGGIVRDILLKKKNLDLDILVEGNAIALARSVSKKMRHRKLTTYQQFGTAHLVLPGEGCIDFARTREEHYAHSGALPSVKPGSLKDDFKRRDFTINAMAISINKESFGELVDEFGGSTDLRKKCIRILHDQSFVDDPTRILRAVRFEQRLGFRIESKTLRLLKEALRENVVGNVKPPRYFAEFKKMLSESNPLPSLRRLQSLRGLNFLSPKFQLDVPQLTRIKGGSRAGGWIIYFMGLMENVDESNFLKALSKFHLTKETQKSLFQSRNTLKILKELGQKKLIPSKGYQILKPLTEDVILYVRLRSSKQNVHRRIDRFLNKDRFVKTKIDGHDLRALGVFSGKNIGKLLQRILYAKIDSKIRNKQEELKYVTAR